MKKYRIVKRYGDYDSFEFIVQQRKFYLYWGVPTGDELWKFDFYWMGISYRTFTSLKAAKTAIRLQLKYDDNRNKPDEITYVDFDDID